MTIDRENEAHASELRESTAAKLSSQKEEHYTYADYCAWDDGKRWELIEGVAYAMSAPLRVHQDISREMLLQFGNFLLGKPCKVYAAPFDVRLNADAADDTVVQPDLLVVCDRSKLDDKGCKGAPDLVVEILSPSTAGYDRIVKFLQYLKAGVKEYWMVYPEEKNVQVCVWKDGQYFMMAYAETDTIPVSVLPGLEIRLPDVFAEVLAPVEGAVSADEAGATISSSGS